MTKDAKAAVKTFLIELALYAALVTGYFFAVLHLLGDWLHDMFTNSRTWYTAVALALVIFQGVFLEALTRYLVNMLQPAQPEEPEP